jgi:FtsZ-interacting cell division protein ZipA
MKLRFRVAAICLAAILVLGVLPSGSVYADNETPNEEETIVTSESDIVVSTDDQQKTEPASSSDDQQKAEPTNFSDEQQKTEPTNSSDEQQKAESTDSSDEQQKTEPTDSSDEQQKTEPTNSSDEQQKADTTTSSDGQQETDTVAESSDASAIDPDALTAWVQEHPEQLSKLYAGDEAAIAALAEALDAELEVVRTYVLALKEQNDLLVKAIEDGTDVLGTISVNTPDDAAEALGVDVISVNLFDIKLSYV